MIERRRWMLAVAWLAVVVGLPLLGRSMRQVVHGRCALDGQKIDPIYRVRIVDASETSREFCCLGCAQHWLEDEPPPREILVTDEISGQELPAERAYFVRSSVVTHRAVGNLIHAFAKREDAVRHARLARGAVLSAAESPFANQRSEVPDGS